MITSAGPASSRVERQRSGGGRTACSAASSFSASGKPTASANVEPSPTTAALMWSQSGDRVEGDVGEHERGRYSPRRSATVAGSSLGRVDQALGVPQLLARADAPGDADRGQPVGVRGRRRRTSGRRPSRRASGPSRVERARASVSVFGSARSSSAGPATTSKCSRRPDGVEQRLGERRRLRGRDREPVALRRAGPAPRGCPARPSCPSSDDRRVALAVGRRSSPPPRGPPAPAPSSSPNECEIGGPM